MRRECAIRGFDDDHRRAKERERDLNRQTHRSRDRDDGLLWGTHFTIVYSWCAPVQSAKTRNLVHRRKTSPAGRRERTIRYSAARVASLSSLDPRLAALSGRQLADRYLVGEALGVGGMGAVFRGEQLKLKRDVAIKVLNPDSSENEDGRMRFAREAESAARLDHENCVQVYDFGTTERLVDKALAGYDMTGRIDTE